MRERRYWEEEEKRVCRLCEGGLETHGNTCGRNVEHGERGKAGVDRRSVVGFGGEGDGEEWMREVEKERRGKVIGDREEGVGEGKGKGYRKEEEREEGRGGEEEDGKERMDAGMCLRYGCKRMRN